MPDDIDLGFNFDFEDEQITQPFGTPLFSENDYSQERLMPGTQCYFCDYAAVARLRGGQPICRNCADRP